MKSNLFKKIGAMVTTVAMIASLGTVAFADASITIGEATCVDSNSDGIYEVTVPYTTSGVTGEVAVLGYVAKEGAGTDTYAAYNETTHTIVGIEQEAAASSITFNVKKDSSNDQSNVTGKDYLYITLGAQGVNAAQTAVIPLATEADDTATVTTAAWVGGETANVAYGGDKAAAAKAVIDAGSVKFDNTYEISVSALVAKNLITIAEPAVDGNKYTYTLTFTAGNTGVTSGGKEIVLGTVAAIDVEITVTEAAAPPVEDPDNYVTIGNAAATWNETDKVFDVTVPYTTTNAKASGEVAMMSYIGRTPEFTGTATETDYTNETDMRIIGIAQKTNGTDGTGTFTYKVTGEIGANTYMVVKVGAQGVNVAPDMVAIPLTKTGAPVVTDITAAYGTVADFEEIANDSDATIIAALNGKTVSIKDDSNAEVATYTLGTVASVDKLSTAVAPGDSSTYGYVTTITAGTDVTETGANTNVIIPADFKVYFNITVAPVEWTVTSGTMAGVSVTVAADADDTAISTAVEEAIVGKKITLTSGTTGQTAETTVVDTWTVAKVEGAATTTYKVTVPADATLENVLPEGADVTMAQIDVEFDVAVTREASENFTITGFKAYDSTGAEVTAIEVANGTTEADAKDAIAAKVASIKALGDGEVAEAGWTASEWTIASYNAETAGDYTATATLAAPDAAKGQNTNSVALTITVTVKAAAPAGFDYVLGDVVKNEGKVQHADWQAILNHITKVKVNADLNDKTKEAFMSADVATNGKIQHADWQAILNHLTKVKVDDKIGKTYNSADYAYKD